MKKTFTLLLSIFAFTLFSQVSVNPSSTITCIPNSAVANFTISSGTAPYSFTVQTPACTSSFTTSTSSTTPSFTLPCQGTYTFTIKNGVGLALGSFTHNVSTYTNVPIITIGVSTPSFITCTNTMVTISITNVSNVGFAGTSILWSNGSIFSSTGFTNVGVASVSVTSNDYGCVGTKSLVIVSNTSPPTLSIVPTAPSCSTCCDGQITITNYSFPLNTFTLNGVDQGNVKIYTNLCNVKQKICATDYNSGCIRCDSIMNLTSVGIKINNLNNNIKVYPNPVSELLTVDLVDFNTSNYHIELINALGQAVLERDITLEKTTLKTQHLKNGIYFLKITANKTIVSTQKIIIEN